MPFGPMPMPIIPPKASKKVVVALSDFVDFMTKLFGKSPVLFPPGTRIEDILNQAERMRAEMRTRQPAFVELLDLITDGLSLAMLAGQSALLPKLALFAKASEVLGTVERDGVHIVLLQGYYNPVSGKGIGFQKILQQHRTQFAVKLGVSSDDNIKQLVLRTMREGRFEPETRPHPEPGFHYVLPLEKGEAVIVVNPKTGNVVTAYPRGFKK